MKRAAKTFAELLKIQQHESVPVSYAIVDSLSKAGCVLPPAFQVRAADTRDVYVDGGVTGWNDVDDDAVVRAVDEAGRETQTVVITPAAFAVNLPISVARVALGITSRSIQATLWMLENFGAHEIDAMYRLGDNFETVIEKLQRETT